MPMCNNGRPRLRCRAPVAYSTEAWPQAWARNFRACCPQQLSPNNFLQTNFAENFAAGPHAMNACHERTRGPFCVRLPLFKPPMKNRLARSAASGRAVSKAVLFCWRSGRAALGRNDGSCAGCGAPSLWPGLRALIFARRIIASCQTQAVGLYTLMCRLM